MGIDMNQKYQEGYPRGVMVKAMDTSQSITFSFWQIPLRKVWSPLSSQLWAK